MLLHGGNGDASLWSQLCAGCASCVTCSELNGIVLGLQEQGGGGIRQQICRTKALW